MRKFFATPLILVAAGMILAGCVTYVPPVRPPPPTLAQCKEAATRVTCELLVHPSIMEFPEKNKGKIPLIETGHIINATSARIQIEQVSERIMEELLNSGQVEVVSDGAILSKPPDFNLGGRIMYQDATYTFQLHLNKWPGATRVWSRSVDIEQ